MSRPCSSAWRRFRRPVEAAVVVLALAAPPAAAADVELRATVSPDRVVFGETRALTYRVEMTTGDAPERFALRASTTTAFGGQGSLLFPGSSRAELEGPGTLTPGSSYHGDIFPCSQSELPERHGGLPGGTEYGLELPPRTTSTLVFDAGVSSTAPWPEDRFGLSLQTSNGTDGTLEAPGDVPVAAPAPAGRTGVRIDLVTDPPSASVCGKPPRIDDRPIAIRGRTDPPLGGQDVLLRYVPPGQREAVALATVRVADDGTFAYDGWRPRMSGVYEVAASYVAQRPERADDFSVPRIFEVGVPAGEPPPETPPRSDPQAPEKEKEAKEEAQVFAPRLFASVVSRRARLGRRGRVQVRLACPAAAGAGCEGALELRRGARRLAARQVRLFAATRRTVALRLRLRARDRRVLRRRGRLAVTVDAGGPARRVLLRR